MAEPARERLLEGLLQAPGDVEEGGCPRAAVEIFIAAADREIGSAAVECYRHSTCAVAEVPQHKRPFRLRARGDPGHVMDFGGLEVDVGQAHDRHVAVDRVHDLVLLDEAQAIAAAQELGETLGDVEIGREIVRLGEDGLAPGLEPECGREQLEEVDRGGVDRDELAGLGTHEAGDLLADEGWKRHPAVLAPALDEVLAPLCLDHLGDARRRRLGQRTERIAVEIEDSFGEGEPLAQWCQRVARIEALEVGADKGCHLDHRSRLPGMAATLAWGKRPPRARGAGRSDRDELP